MKFSKLQLNTGNSLHIYSWGQNKAEENRPNILLLHGIESHAQWFHEIAELLVQKGYCVWSFDRQGFGQSGGPRGHMESIESVTYEFQEVRSHIVETTNRPITKLVGMSWGGMFLIYAAIQGLVTNESIVLLAPGIYPSNTPSIKELFTISMNINSSTEQVYSLAYMPHDFCSDQAKQKEILNDPYRITRLSANSCYVTGKMQKVVKMQARALNSKYFCLVLPEEDSIIDIKKTANLLDRFLSISIKASKHSLILDQPMKIATLIDEFKG